MFYDAPIRYHHGTRTHREFQTYCLYVEDNIFEDDWHKVFRKGHKRLLRRFKTARAKTRKPWRFKRNSYGQ